jgi:arylsulfatase A-like enzyme
MYDAGIRWVDAQLSSLVGTLRQSKLWENCIFALTADHGEEFLDHQGRYHAPSLAEELIHVPLLLRVPGAKKATVCGNPFSLLHLAPTLLGAAGLPVPTHFQGSDYWPCLRDQTAWSAPAIAESIAGCTNPFHTEQCAAPCMLAVREAKYKLVLNFNSRPDSPSETLFDLESDPGEQHPLPPKPRSPERKRLLEAALNHLQRTHPARHSEAYLRARLRDIKRNLIATGLPQAAPPAIQTLAG